MTIYPEDTKWAVRQLGSGWTTGMVDSALKKRGVGSGPRAEVIVKAKRIVNRRSRMKHLFLAMLGALVIVGGACWCYYCVVDQDRRVRTPVLVMTVGLLLATYGLYNATQNEV
jgi:hypothetical protein